MCLDDRFRACDSELVREGCARTENHDSKKHTANECQGFHFGTDQLALQPHLVDIGRIACGFSAFQGGKETADQLIRKYLILPMVPV